MAINFNDNIKVSANKPLDFKFGPFESIAQANSLIPESQRYHGLIFGVYTLPLDLANSDIEFYYYWDDLSDTSYKRLLFEQNFIDAINASQNASGDNPFVTLEQLTLIIGGGGNVVLFGGVPQWTGTGLIFDAPYTGYIVDGTYYEDGPEQITLTDADPSNPRRDRFILSSAGWGYLTGTPAAIPVAEQINLITEIDRGDVLIGAGATVPTVTNEVVYKENVEWTTSSGGVGTFNAASTASPCTDAVSFESTNVQAGGFMLFTRSTDYDFSTATSIGMNVRLKSNMNNGRSLRVQFFDSIDTPVSQSVILPMNKSLSGTCQFCSLTKDQLGFVNTTVRKFRITYSGVGGPATYSGFFVDDIVIQGGISQPEGPQNIILGNEVSGTGTTGAEVPVSLTEKAISNRAENTSPVDADMLLLRRNSDGALMKVSRLNFLKRSVVDVYANDAAMFAAQANQQENNIYQSGTSFYKYKGTTAGDITDYTPFGGGGSVGAGAGLSIDGGGDIQLGSELVGDASARVIDIRDWDNMGYSYLLITTDPDSWITGSASPNSNLFQDKNTLGIFTYLTDIRGAWVQSYADSSDSYSEISANSGAGMTYDSVSVRVDSTTGAEVYDGLFEKGLTYAADYSTAGTADPRWIPDWGAVEAAVADATPDDYTPQTGTTLSFDGPNKYGFNGTPLTGNLTFASTGAKETVMIKALHNSGTEPTLTPPGGVTLIREGVDYTVSVDNILYAICHKNDAGAVTHISYSWTKDNT